MIFQILTLFPVRYDQYIETGLPARAAKKGLFELRPVNLRDFADPGRKDRIDDLPYGGGPGMLVQVGPVDRALNSLEKTGYRRILMSPAGNRLNQKTVRRLSRESGLTIVCGYYEGVDHRVSEHLIDEEISVGDFILGSGDLAALTLIESITRLIPGYMGSSESHLIESHEQNTLEYPQYTRPEIYNNWSVPSVLLSGNHKNIEEWRQQQSLIRTEKRLQLERENTDLEDNNEH